jgi:hypothetical protein
VNDNSGKPLADNKVMLGKDQNEINIYNYEKTLFYDYTSQIKKRPGNEPERIYWYASFYETESGRQIGWIIPKIFRLENKGYRLN